MNTEKIKEVFNEKLGFTNQNKVIIIVIVVLCIAAVVAWDCFGRSDVYSDRNTVDAVDAGLSNAITGQQAVTGKLRDINEGLGRAEREIGVSEVTVIKVSKSLTDSSAILRRDAEIIARDAEIFEKIKKSKN